MFEPTRYDRGRPVEAKFVIPAGSIVSVRNLKTGKKWPRYRTKKTLYFFTPVNIGYGGACYTFQHEEWLIGVNAEVLNG